MQNSMTQAPQGRASRRQIYIAGALGLLAAVLVIILLGDRSASNGQGSDSTVSVVVAAQPIAAGELITDALLTTKTLPPPAIPEDSFQDKALLKGKTVRYPIAKGEPITTARLIQPSGTKSLSFQIPPGMRGMTIPVNPKNTPAALIAPGDFVDVILSVDLVTLTGRAVPTPVGSDHPLRGSSTILQNVQVLSVDRYYVANGVVYDSSTRGTPPDEKTDVTFVTLALTPDQAQLLWLAADGGKLTLVLRPFGEDTLVPLAPRAEPIQLP
jgi:pilus assembly protein CpaB